MSVQNRSLMKGIYEIIYETPKETEEGRIVCSQEGHVYATFAFPQMTGVWCICCWEKKEPTI